MPYAVVLEKINAISIEVYSLTLSFALMIAEYLNKWSMASCSTALDPGINQANASRTV